MSAEERAFVVSYIRALRQDFWRVQTVMSLMDPDNGLAIEDFTHAIDLAAKINELHVEFEYNLLEAAGHLWKPMSKIKNVDMPTVDQLAELFTLSFFKLISVAPFGPAGLPKKKDNGWSSGAPGTIQTALNLLETGFFDKKPDPATNNTAAGLAAVVLDLFSKLFDWSPPDVNDGSSAYFANWVPYLTNPHTPDSDYYDEDEYYDDDDDDDDEEYGSTYDDDDDYDDN